MHGSLRGLCVQSSGASYDAPKVKNLDFVCGWYKKANDLIKETHIEVGFVSTNSITQGETVARFWDFVDFKINFTYKTFVWDSEANLKH